jgi:PEP-CTERM motif
MTTFHKSILGILFAGIATFPASAETISAISFTSNFGRYINDTIVGNSTSPLAFTANTDLAQPFLNAADSSITLGYGHYYAIAFIGFGGHLGAGTISFTLDGVGPYSQSVTFPDPISASAVFASFALPGGDAVTVSATGLSADRISIVPDGGGLTPDGAADAFYEFDFTQGSSVPEPATGVLLVAGLAMALAVRRRHLAR